ncbi:Dihydrolipoyllysine-residue acetyltransferase component of pyruvate dehydrogenase complex [bacterium HR21]|nr:Dihydrolipoyllysine-residue acetyltransferase component of pyruvate dehydrogenase complex [bacterium HR21]
MRVDVVMPKMGESVQEGKIIRWVKKVGERVEQDETLLEISTDKVDTEIPAPASGVVAEILFPEGETVPVGKVIARIETEVTAAPSAQEAPTAPAQSPRPAEAPPVTGEAAPGAAPSAVPAASPALSESRQLVDVVMPKMGESVQEGKIIRWVKKVGERVEQDETLLEISTDKVDTEIPAPASGVVAEILFPEGETVPVGKVIARIAVGTAGEVPPSTPRGEPAPVEAQPVSAPSPAPAQEVAPTPVAVVQPSVSPVSAPGNGDGQRQPATRIPRTVGGRFFSPLVRAIAEAEGITPEELERIPGTGLEGRVTKHDLLRYLEQRRARPVPPAMPTPAVPEPAVQPEPTVRVTEPVAAPAPVAAGPEVEVIPMDHVRQLIAEHMVRSKQTSPHVTAVDEADVTNLVRIREKYKEEFERREGIRLTYLPFFVRAAVEALKQYPLLNASVEGKNILVHKRINIGIATVLPNGNLIVPVIKNADALSITGLARAIADLAQRARTKKLLPDEVQGGTFSVTNFGSFGTLLGTPIINQPQVAILGIGLIQKRPVVREIEGSDVILVRHMVYLSLSFDHRIIDGMLAGQFLQAVRQSLEAMTEETLLL